MAQVAAEVQVWFPALHSGLKDLVLPTAAAKIATSGQIESLAQEFPYVSGVAIKKKKKKKKVYQKY